MKFPLLLPALSLLAVPVHAAVLGPYTADGNTIALFHFNEAAGTSDPGNPIGNYGSGGATLNLTNTGGPDGRSNSNGGGYGGASISGFGTSFNVLASGDGTYHSGGSGSTTGGGAMTSSQAILQSSLQGANGAMTLEAIVNFSSFTSGQEYTILSHDGLGTGTTNRGFIFRIDTSGNLSLYTGAASVAVALPSSGANAFSTNAWFHLAVSYNGAEGVANNVAFYWTAIDAGGTQANLIGNATIAADLDGNSSNALGIGTTTRSEFRFEMPGRIDEVRISDIARGPGDFLFVPEPSVAVLGCGGVFALLMARRRR